MTQDKFRAVVAHYRAEISEGRMVVGSRMPTVREITSEWDISKATGQKVMEALRDEGLIATRQGHRSVVAGPQIDLVVAIERPMMVLSTRVDTADAGVAQSLGVAEGCNVLVVRLVTQPSARGEGEADEGPDV